MKSQVSPKLKFLFITKVNRWARDWEKVFRKHISHKGLFLRIVMNFYKSTMRRHVIITKWTKNAYMFKRNTYECPIGMWKSAQHRLYNANVQMEMQKLQYKVRPQHEPTPCPLEWLQFERLAVGSAGRDGQSWHHLHVGGGSVTC